MRAYRTVLLSGGVISLLLSSLAHGGERLVIPYSCKVHGGHVDLIPSTRQAYRVYGARERQVLTTCSLAVPGRCRSWTLHRFDLDCGGTRVPWPRVVAAVSDRQTPGLAWLADGRLHVRMGPWWAGAFASPCRGARWWYGSWPPYEPPYEPSYDPPYERPYLPPPAYWRCTDQPSPRSAVDFPPGFAPLMGTQGRFIAATAPRWTELAKNPPLSATVPKAPAGAAKHQEHAAPANDSGAQSEQRAGSFPAAAKIKNQEAAVTPGRTTNPSFHQLKSLSLVSRRLQHQHPQKRPLQACLRQLKSQRREHPRYSGARHPSMIASSSQLSRLGRPSQTSFERTFGASSSCARVPVNR